MTQIKTPRNSEDSFSTRKQLRLSKIDEEGNMDMSQA
jgi:hypothetical protein